MALMCDEEMTQCFIPYIDQQPFLHPPEFNFNGVLASYLEAAERGGMLLPGANHEAKPQNCSLVWCGGWLILASMP
jgi:hypothetical protein